jgi:hypothetical protein
MHNKHLRTLLNCDRLDSIFRDIGAQVKSLEAGTELAPNINGQSTNHEAISPLLRSIAELLERAAPLLVLIRDLEVLC